MSGFDVYVQNFFLVPKKIKNKKEKNRESDGGESENEIEMILFGESVMCDCISILPYYHHICIFILDLTLLFNHLFDYGV